MEISEKGIKFIQTEERFEPKSYECSAGHWTIGYGSTYYPDGTQVKSPDPPISEPDADLLMRHVCGNYQDIVNKLLFVQLNQNQFDAIMSFVYNEGPGQFKSSTLLKRINEDPNDRTRISYEFSRWNKEEDPKTKKLKPSKGLTARRKRETDLYFS